MADDKISEIGRYDFALTNAETFSVRVASFLLAAISSIIIARTLGPTGKGIATIILLYYTLLFSFGHLGIGRSMTYYLGKKEYKTEEFITNALILAFILSIILIALFL